MALLSPFRDTASLPDYPLACISRPITLPPSHVYRAPAATPPPPLLYTPPSPSIPPTPPPQVYRVPPDWGANVRRSQMSSNHLPPSVLRARLYFPFPPPQVYRVPPDWGANVRRGQMSSKRRGQIEPLPGGERVVAVSTGSFAHGGERNVYHLRLGVKRAEPLREVRGGGAGRVRKEGGGERGSLRYLRALLITAERGRDWG
jgi:hypothetical protein